MISENPAFSQAFHESVKWLLELHREMSAGDPDGPKADAIRDQMERPWYEMTSDEQDLIRGLSADLYSIGADRQHSPTSDVTGIENFKEAVRSKKWGDVLKYTRKHEDKLPPVHVAQMRAYGWDEFNEPNVAVAFFQESLRLDPDQPIVEAILIDKLVRSDRLDLAIPYASRAITNASSPVLLVLAFDALVSAASQRIVPENDSFYTQLSSAVESVLIQQSQELRPEIANLLLGRWAFCFWKLQHVDQARVLCQAILSISPKDILSAKILENIGKRTATHTQTTDLTAWFTHAPLVDVGNAIQYVPMLN